MFRREGHLSLLPSGGGGVGLRGEVSRDPSVAAESRESRAPSDPSAAAESRESRPSSDPSAAAESRESRTPSGSRCASGARDVSLNGDPKGLPRPFLTFHNPDLSQSRPLVFSSFFTIFFFFLSTGDPTSVTPPGPTEYFLSPSRDQLSTNPGSFKTQVKTTLVRITSRTLFTFSVLNPTTGLPQRLYF